MTPSDLPVYDYVYVYDHVKCSSGLSHMGTGSSKLRAYAYDHVSSESAE